MGYDGAPTVYETQNSEIYNFVDFSVRRDNLEKKSDLIRGQSLIRLKRLTRYSNKGYVVCINE